MEMAGTDWATYSGTALEDIAGRFQTIAASWEELRETAAFFGLSVRCAFAVCIRMLSVVLGVDKGVLDILR